MKSTTLILPLIVLTLLIALSTEAPATDMATGQKVYDASCGACHNSGVMGAPKLGDKAAWAGLIAEGVDTLTANAIHGEGKMPPKGGNMKLTDAEVKAAVDYLVEKSR